MESTYEAERIHKKTDYDLIFRNIDRFKIPQNSSILDVGCASGDVLKAHFEKGYCDCSGLDFSFERLRFAKNLLKDHCPKLYSADAYHLPFKNETFDMVHSRFLFEYLKEPLKCLIEMKRVTKIGGKVIVGDLDGNCVFNAIMDKQLEAAFQSVMEKLSITGFDPYIGRKLFTYFHEAGFEDVKVFAEIYHKIFGKINQKDKENWNAKIQNISRLIGSPENQKILSDIIKSFNAFLESERTLTYSVLFYVVGNKNN
jgi:ubiquinone/menaquinone biosynthesis C-methylase UbiE